MITLRVMESEIIPGREVPAAQIRASMIWPIDHSNGLCFPPPLHPF